MKNTICFVAGHSGGHITPCLTLAREFRKKDPTTNIVFFTSADPLAQQLTQESVINHRYNIRLNKFPYKKIYAYPLFAMQFFWALIKSLFIFICMRPTRVITTGGYIAIPVCYAARALGIPIELWELNVVPGKAIAWLAKHAAEINVCYEQTKNYLKSRTCTLQPYPVRFGPEQKISPEQARAQLNLQQNKFTIFILGGSQGSQELNKLVQICVQQDPETAHHLQVIHQTGRNNLARWRTWCGEHKIPAIVFDYVADLAPFFCAADLIVSRAGAGALAEIAFFEKQALIIPLKFDRENHQWHNAQAYANLHNAHATVSTFENSANHVIELIKKLARTIR